MGLDHVIKVIGDYWDEHSSEFDKEQDTEDSKTWETTLSEMRFPGCVHGGKCTGTAVYGRFCGLHNKRASALDSDRAQKGPERVVPGNPSGRKGNVF